MSWKIESENLALCKLSDSCVLYVYKEEGGIKLKIMEHNKETNKDVVIFLKAFDNKYLGVLK